MLKSKRIVALLVTFIMLLSMLPTLAFAGNTGVGIELAEAATLALEKVDGYQGVATFTPEKDGVYIFTVATNAMVNLNANFYDVNITEACDALWSSGGSSFEQYCYLYGGATYYLYINATDIGEDAPDQVNVSILAERLTVNSINITDYPELEYYDTELDEVDYWDLVIEAHYSNGSNDYYSYNEWYEDWYNVSCELDDDPASDTYGTVTVTFDEATATFKLNIKVNPVKKVEYIGKPIEIVENTNCFEDIDNYEQPFTYYYEPASELSRMGKVFKVTFKDNTVKTYGLWDDQLYLDDLELYTVTDQYNEHWEKGKNNYMYAYMLGFEIKIPVKIVETPVKSVKITKVPSYVYTYGDMYEGYFTYEGKYDMWPLEIDDLAFTVTYKDGTVKNYTGYDIDTNREILDGAFCSVDTYIEDATVGKHPITINVNGVKATYNITVKEPDVTKVELTKKPTVTKYTNYLIPSFVGAEITLTYKNNSTKVLKVTKDNIYLEDKSVFVCDETDRPIAYFKHNYENETYTLTSYKSTVPVTCMQYVGSEYSSIEIKNYNPNFEGMEIVAKKANGSDTFKINDDIKNFGGGFGSGDPDVKIYFANTYTDKGIFRIEMVLSMYNGVPAHYYAHAFGCDWEKTVLTEELVAKSVSIAKEPDKVRYEVGETFDPTGLELYIDYGNGKKGHVYYDYLLGEDNCPKVSAVDTSKQGDKTVTVTFEGKTATFKIKVSNGFADVKKGIWYEKYVNYAASFGIFDGTDEVKNLFSPDTDLTRAQVVKVIANFAGIDTSDNSVKSGFSDVPSGKWYTGAVKWAKDVGITEGVGDGTFRPEDKITREQLCVMLASYVEDYMNCDFIKNRAGFKFKDDAQISSWAKASVDICYRAGLVSGMGDGTFAPKQNASRAHGATIFAEFHEDFPVW